MIEVNPAKQVDNPQRRRTEKRRFESWAQLASVASTREFRRPDGAFRGRDGLAARGVDRA
jgi:hypothetical protein